MNSKVITITLLVIAIVLCIVFAACRTSTGTSTIVEFDPPIPTAEPEPDPIPALDDNEDFFDETSEDDTTPPCVIHNSEDFVWNHADWIDGEKFYDAYIAHLEASLTANAEGTFDANEYERMIRVFAVVGECMIVRESVPYGKVVYDSSTHYLHGYSTDFEFVKEEVEEALALVKQYRSNPADYPFSW